MEPGASQIRLATPDECDLLSELGIRSKAVWNYSATALETFRNELIVTPEQVAASLVFVTSVNETIVGYYTLQPVDEATIELQHLFVDPHQLRRGHGSQLLHHSQGVARSRGYIWMVIQSDPNAVCFYEAHGIPVVRQIPSSIPGRFIPELEVRL